MLALVLNSELSLGLKPELSFVLNSEIFVVAVDLMNMHRTASCENQEQVVQANK
jgi:hypothetical protein